MFSPSPAPRRTVQRHITPSKASPAPQIRRPRVGGSKPTSRLATPVRQHAERFPSVRDDESVESGMDVDENADIFDRGLKTETIFAKSGELVVTFYAHLPVEVKQILRSANFFRDPYTGDVDTVTGYALVASAETCFVWKYAQALTGTPTCYIFSCPREAVPMAMATPFHALVPYGPSREPGLILMNSAGQIRFWDGLGMGLAGGEHYSSSSLDLQDEERVTTLTRVDPQTFIASTSIGRLHRLTLTSSAGKYQLNSHPFSRPQSALSLSRLIPTFWSPEASPEAGNINAVALSDSDPGTSSRRIWTLIDFRIQRWNMSAEGWEELEFDEDVAEAVRPALREEFESASRDDAELDLELLDLKIASSTGILLLVSYAGQEDFVSMDVGVQPRRIFAIVQLSQVAGSFRVDDVKSVPYQSTSSSGAPIHPRLQSILNGQLISIQFGDAVTLCARDTEYMDRLELKSTTDRTLGVGVVQEDSQILVLTAGTLMRAWVDLDAVARFDPETGRATLIKHIMSQAILYGSLPENPLHFSFPPEVDEEALMSGAEMLSQSVLESDTSVVRPNHDLQAQMTSRKERLSFLIKFINDNGVLTKMSQRSRQRLATDAEKLFGAHQLWLQHNELLAHGLHHTVLSEAIYVYMNSVGEGHHEDFIRAFFRLKVDDLGSLLPHVLSIVRKASNDPTKSLMAVVAQANSIILTVLQCATEYRKFNDRVYGIEYPIIRPWTSQLFIIDIVSQLFEITAKLAEVPTDSDPSKVQTKAQLPELASALFTCYNERLQWLSSPLAANGPDREKNDLEERFKHARSEVSETLRRYGFALEAFTLAEKYRDFRTLASLCHKETIYPPQDNPHATRIQLYIDKFGEDFATELYQWYIEHGELRIMFAQEYGTYLDKFFAEHPYPQISWIHDLGKGRYGAASETLLTEADRASELMSKHLQLSIGKLSHLAQMHEGDGSTISEPILDAFHDGLDFVSVHETLIEELKSALAPVRTKQSLEMQVDTIVKAKATKLGEHRALHDVFRQLVRRLLQGKALSVEDAADILSLKDNDSHVDDYVTALHLLSCAKTLPETRRLSAFRSVWRRIYIHDDWNKLRQTMNVADAELNQRFKNTALHAALQATMHKHHQPAGYVLRPSEALPIPTQTEIATRWSGVPPEEVSALERDYQWESDHVAELQLEEVFERVSELASEDGHWMDTV